MVYKRLSYHLNRNSVLHKQYYIHIHRILYAFPTGKFCKTLRATRHKSPMSSCSQGKVTQLLCGTRVLATWPKRHRIQSVRNDSLSWSVKTSKASCHVQDPEELSANARKTSCPAEKSSKRWLLRTASWKIHRDVATNAKSWGHRGKQN